MRERLVCQEQITKLRRESMLAAKLFLGEITPEKYSQLNREVAAPVDLTLLVSYQTKKEREAKVDNLKDKLQGLVRRISAYTSAKPTQSPR